MMSVAQRCFRRSVNCLNITSPAPRLIFWIDVALILRRIANVCRGGGGLLIGVDLKKDRQVLEAAYNDSAGVTAEFNLNLLKRINRESGTDFDLHQWRHRAIYNPDAGRIEMRLTSET